MEAVRYPNNSQPGPDPVLSSFRALSCNRRYLLRGWRKKRNSNPYVVPENMLLKKV